MDADTVTTEGIVNGRAELITRLQPGSYRIDAHIRLTVARDDEPCDMAVLATDIQHGLAVAFVIADWSVQEFHIGATIEVEYGADEVGPLLVVHAPYDPDA